MSIGKQRSDRTIQWNPCGSRRSWERTRSRWVSSIRRIHSTPSAKWQVRCVQWDLLRY